MQTIQASKIREWLDSQDFYEYCYAYRITVLATPEGTIQKFEQLKDVIEAKFIDLTGDTMEEDTNELRTPKRETIIKLQVVSSAITLMYKDVETHEDTVLRALNELHGINYPYPYTSIDRDFYDAYKSLRDLQLKLREAASALSAK